MIRFGILGAGRVVKNRYVEVFRDELQNCRVVMVCDKVNEKSDEVAKLLNAEAVYQREELYNNSDIDVVLVATESGKHFKHSMEALQSGKHVIVEKPPALMPEEIISCEKYAKEKGLMFAVVFQNRLNPAMQILKKTYEEDRFGKIVLATIRLRWCRYQDYYEDGWHGTWAMDGGVINQQAIHHIDALQWVCGKISSVVAAQTNALNTLEAEDTTVGIVKFENNVLGVVEATTAARPEDFEASMSVVGEKGMVVIGGIALNKIHTWNFVEKRSEDEIIPSTYSQEVPTGYGLSHGPLVQKIVDLLSSGNTSPPITGTDTLDTMALVHALYSSSETGKWVRLKNNPMSERLGKKDISL